MYREVIWHPDVTERMNAAFAKVIKRGDSNPAAGD